MIQVAAVTFENRLEAIDAKLESIFKSTVTDSDEDAAELRRMREDRLSTHRCLQICDQLASHLDQIELPTTREGRSPSGLIDPVKLTGEAIRGYRESVSSKISELENNMDYLIDRLVKKSKSAMSDEDEAVVLSKLQAEWGSLRGCMQACSQAGIRLNENISIIDNFATGDHANQYLVSTNNKTIHGQNRGYGEWTNQLGGHMSDESLQRVSDNISRASLHDSRGSTPPQAKTVQVPGEWSDRSGASFQAGRGRGLKPKSGSTLDNTTLPRTPATSKVPQENEPSVPEPGKHARSESPDGSEPNAPEANSRAKRSSPGPRSS